MVNHIPHSRDVLPQAIESEQALLCACFLRPDIIPQVKELLSPLDFYRDANAIIYSALCDVGKQSDPVSIGEYLKKTGLFDKAGGMVYISSLIDISSTSAGWKYHSEIIRDRANRRNMIQLCQRSMDLAFDLTSEYEETLSNHKVSIREYEVDTQTTENETNLVLCNRILKDIERRIETKNPYSGIKLGFDNIDQKMWGLEAGTTLYVIARPSMGKTALCLNIADYVSTHNEGLVIYFSLESSSVYLMRRVVSAHSAIGLTKLRQAEILDEQWPNLNQSLNDISGNKNLRLLSNPRYKVVEHLISRVETLALESPITLIVVDHIQRMSTSTKRQSRHLEISYISEQLTTLAQSLNIPMIVLSQIRRGAPGTKEGRPQLSDLKECVTGGTEVYTDKGPRTIRTLFKKHRDCNFKILSFDFDCVKTKWIAPKQIIQTGKQKCFTIRTKSGYTVAVSGDTLLYSRDGWKKVSDLQVGVEILVDKSIAITRKGIQSNRGSSHFKHGQNPWNKDLTAQTDKRVYETAQKCKGPRNGLIVTNNFREIMRKAHPPIGMKKNNRGYTLIYKPEWPSSNGHNSCWKGYVFEHRYIVEKHIGRMLEKSEVVHHIDGDKRNNDISNLLLCTNSKEHEQIHQKEMRFTESLIKSGKVIWDETIKDFRFR